MYLVLWLFILLFVHLFTTALTLPFGIASYLAWIPMRYLRPSLKNPRIFRHGGTPATSLTEVDSPTAALKTPSLSPRRSFFGTPMLTPGVSFRNLLTGGDSPGNAVEAFDMNSGEPNSRFADTAWHFDADVHPRLFSLLVQQPQVRSLWPMMRDKFWEIRLLHGKFKQMGDHSSSRRGAVNEMLELELLKLGGEATHPTVANVTHAFLRSDGPVKRCVCWSMRVLRDVRPCLRV